jgi:DNA-binding NarL/FixJ family response regulator
MIRVLLADDHEVVRFGLGVLISGEGDLTLVGTAEDGDQAVAMCSALRPDVVIMDLSMPRVDGVTAIRRIRAQQPSVRVLALTSHSQESFARRALAAGADGYLLKDCPAREIIEAVRSVHEGGSPMSPVAKRLALG